MRWLTYTGWAVMLLTLEFGEGDKVLPMMLFSLGLILADISFCIDEMKERIPSGSEKGG